MVSSSSLTPSELNNPYLETRRVLFIRTSQRCWKNQDTRRYRDSSTSACTPQPQAKTTGPQPNHFPSVLSNTPIHSVSLSKFPRPSLYPGLQCLPKVPPPRSAPSLHFLKTCPSPCRRSGTPAPPLAVTSPWQNSSFLTILS